MANDMNFAFKAEDIKMLLEKGAVTINATSKLESAMINGKPVAVMVVTAVGLNKENKAVAMVKGCPCPPCTALTLDRYK